MPPSDAVHQSALGLRKPAAEPRRYGQLPPGDRIQQPLTLADHGQGLCGERSRTLGVTAELGEIAAIDRNYAGTFTSMLAALPTVGSNGSSTASPAARSAASSSASTASRPPLVVIRSACASSSRGRTGPG